MDSTRVMSDRERDQHLSPGVQIAARNGLEPGDMLAGRFAIVRFLARGGMGEVYEAEDRFLHGDLIALKMIALDLAHEPDAEEWLQQEVLLARQVTHPNVCPIYDLFHCELESGRSCFLTMKLLRGETLAQRLDRLGSLRNEEALAIIRQIACALRAAHEAGVVHRDFKPNNIMLEGEGANVKATVTDFGLARQYAANGPAASAAHICGTPGYIAPEVRAGHAAIPASDLYAFGVVVHEIYAGERPFLPGDEESPGSDRQVGSTPRFIARMVKGCLDAEPGKRYRAFEEALTILDPGRRTGSNHFATRAPTRRTVLASGAALLGAAVGGIFWQRDEIEHFLQPLPQKRFVALLAWPRTNDERTRPMLHTVMEAIAAELPRYEAADRDLFVISEGEVLALSGGATELKRCCDSVGANLVLAASGVLSQTMFHLSLKVLDAASSAVMRERSVKVALREGGLLAAKAVRAAADLLDIAESKGADQRLKIGTNSMDAYRAYQAAEEKRVQLNDAGLDAAIAGFNDAIEKDTRFGDAYARLARAYCRKFVITREPSFLQLASANCELALRLDARSVDAHVVRAWIFEHTGEQQKALQEVGEALAIDPENSRTLVEQAQVYLRMNRLSEAEATYKRLTKDRPNDWIFYNELGCMLNDQGRYKEALQNFRVAATAAPRAAVALNNVGAMYLNLGQFDVAAAYFGRSVAAAPNYDAYSSWAELLRAQRKFRESLPYSLKAVAINESSDQGLLDLGDCYEQLGKTAEAQQAYAKAYAAANRRVQIDATDGSAWMMLAICQTKSKAGTNALALLQKAQLLGANDLDSQLTKVRILELHARRREALEALAECVKRGATPVQVALIPDLDALRKDPGYLRLAQAPSAARKSNPRLAEGPCICARI